MVKSHLKGKRKLSDNRCRSSTVLNAVYSRLDFTQDPVPTGFMSEVSGEDTDLVIIKN